MYFVWSARRCLDPHWLRAAQSHFGTAPAPGHVRQFWCFGSMTRPPHAASSVVGYASDTASAVAKVEPNSNRSRETGRPYWYADLLEPRTAHWNITQTPCKGYSCMQDTIEMMSSHETSHKYEYILYHIYIIHSMPTSCLVPVFDVFHYT